MPAPPRLEAESVQATTRVEALERGVQPGTDAQRACMLMTAFASAPDQVWGALGAQINADDAAWDDALAESRRLVRELGEKLVPAGQVSPVSTLPAPFVRVSLRIEEIVRSWPASIRARQRASLEREASDLFARAVKGRSEGLLRRVVAEHEGSVKWGEAAELLGDIAFARGVTAHRPYAGGDVHPSTAWHAQFADVNNDGRPDLFVVKGNIGQMPDFAMLDPSNLLLGTPEGRFVEAGDAADPRAGTILGFTPADSIEPAESEEPP